MADSVHHGDTRAHACYKRIGSELKLLAVEMSLLNGIKLKIESTGDLYGYIDYTVRYKFRSSN